MTIIRLQALDRREEGERLRQRRLIRDKVANIFSTLKPAPPLGSPPSPRLLVVCAHVCVGVCVRARVCVFGAGTAWI